MESPKRSPNKKRGSSEEGKKGTAAAAGSQELKKKSSEEKEESGVEYEGEHVTAVNIKGSMQQQQTKGEEKCKPISTPKQIHRGLNKNLMKMRLVSQQDDLDGDDASPSPASPHVREFTDGNESLGYDYGRGKQNCHDVNLLYSL